MYPVLIINVFASNVDIVQDPDNEIVCEGRNATFTCIIFDDSTNHIADTTGWTNWTNKAIISSKMVNNTRKGDTVTSELIIVNVPLYANNTAYLCNPKRGVDSSIAVLFVIGEYNMFIVLFLCIYVRISPQIIWLHMHDVKYEAVLCIIIYVG